MSFAVRSSLQDWTQLVDYMPAALWEQLLSQTVNVNQKLHSLIDHALSLGLRYPSEPTCQVLASVYLICSEGLSQAISTPPQMKYEIFRAVKLALKKQLAMREVPSTICTRLPDSPEAFQAQHGEQWAKAFSSGLPVPSQIPHVDVHRVKLDMPMRSSNFGANTVMGHRHLQRQQSNQQLEAPPQVNQMLQQMQMQMNQFQGFAMAAAQHFGLSQQGGHALGRGPQIHFQAPSALPLPYAPNELQPIALQRLQVRVADAAIEHPGLTPLALVTQPSPSVQAAATHDDTPATVQTNPELSASNGLIAEKKPSNKKSVDEVTSLLMQSLSQRVEDKKETKRLEKEAKKSEKVKEASEAKAKKPKSKEVAKKILKTKHVEEQTLKAKKVAEETAKAKPPCVGHEASRSQYMCRTGLPGKGQTKAIKYVSKEKGSQLKAKAAADQWLKEQMKLRGLA